MKTVDVPFNLELAQVNAQAVQAMRPVTSLDFFENVSGELHDDGLFSVLIFGRVGDEVRDKRFSFIDIKTEVFHPFIYRILTKLRGLYRDILSGDRYAVWDEKINDFSPSDEVNGETGYAFFIKHWSKIQFVSRGGSGVRDQRIALINKYRDRALTNRVLVMPAGLRDIEQGNDGRYVVADINSCYRKLVAYARNIPDSDYANTSQTHNLPRHLLQLAFNEIYDTIEKMIAGKEGFLQKRWGSRRVFDGTRNVITAMDTSTEELGGQNAVKYTDTVVGLHQMTEALGRVTIHHLKNNYLSEVFSPGNGIANLVDPTTLKREQVALSADTYDRWTTVEGLEKVVASYAEPSLRDKPVTLDGRYVALIYTGEEQTFRVFWDIDELPADRDRKHVRPINLMELLYLSGYRIWNHYTGQVTRYPVTGTGSCYATTVYVKTTIEGEVRFELGDDWQIIDRDTHAALEFPTYHALAYLESLVISSWRLEGLGADFDGDMATFNAFQTDEANEEVKQYLKSKAAYVDPRGGLRASSSILTIELVLKNMTGP